MGMDLVGTGGGFRFSGGSWWWVLKLAYDYGWKPKGTKPSKITIESGLEGEWSKDYFTNMYQIVEEDDAKNIASALEKALVDIPEKRYRKMPRILNDHFITQESDKVSPVQYWSGKTYKQHIERFINYCKTGGFCIG